MLGTLRRNKNSPIIIAVLGVVVLLMIGFGVSLQGADPNAYAAKVNGEVISEAQFASRYASEYERRQQTDPKYDRLAAEKDDLRRFVLDQMITVRLLAQEAERMGFAVDNDALREAVVSTPYFQVDGRFNRDQYERVLNSVGTSDREYEAAERERLLAEKLFSAIQTIGASESELWEAYAVNASQIEFEYVAVPKSAFDAEIGSVTDADVAAWEAKTEDVQAELEKLYKARKADRYDIPRRACASQILVRMNSGMPPDVKQQQKEKIGRAGEALKAGTPFEEVVAQFSEDGQGGDLGCFAAGTAIPAVEEAAFALEPGRVSPIFESGFGFHIVKLHRFEEPVRRKLVDVEGELKRELAGRARTDAKARGLAKEILLATAETETLFAALESLESPVPLSAQTSGPVALSRSFVPGLTGDVEPLLKAVWGLPEDADRPELPVELADAYVAFRIEKRTDPDRAEFDRRKDIMLQIQVPTKLNDVVPAWQKSLQQRAKVVVNPRILTYGS